MKAETPYIHLARAQAYLDSGRSTAGTLLDGGEEVVQRALALRCLEIPVGDFISDAMKGDLPDIKGCKELLESNVKMKINHDIALTSQLKHIKIPARFEAEAERIKKAWLELDRHPVLKAVVLERSVFFVLLPIFRFLGDTGLRTTSADISRDEQTHVAANTLVCEELGLKSDKELNKLRRATVAWVLQSLKGEDTSKHLSSNFWMASSDSLYTRGKAEGLIETRASVCLHSSRPIT